MAGTMSEGKMLPVELPVEVSEGHLFPYYHMDKTLEVSSFYSGVCPLPIQGSSLWPVFYSLSLYQGYGSNHCLSSPDRNNYFSPILKTGF